MKPGAGAWRRAAVCQHCGTPAPMNEPHDCHKILAARAREIAITRERLEAAIAAGDRLAEQAHRITLERLEHP